jgi:hypothetical protein
MNIKAGNHEPYFIQEFDATIPVRIGEETVFRIPDYEDKDSQDFLQV